VTAAPLPMRYHVGWTIDLPDIGVLVQAWAPDADRGRSHWSFCWEALDGEVGGYADAPSRSALAATIGLLTVHPDAAAAVTAMRVFIQHKLRTAMVADHPAHKVGGAA
jgi:hypothetical protein